MNLTSTGFELVAWLALVLAMLSLLLMMFKLCHHCF